MNDANHNQPDLNPSQSEYVHSVFAFQMEPIDPALTAGQSNTPLRPTSQTSPPQSFPSNLGQFQNPNSHPTFPPPNPPHHSRIAAQNNPNMSVMGNGNGMAPDQGHTFNQQLPSFGFQHPTQPSAGQPIATTQANFHNNMVNMGAQQATQQPQPSFNGHMSHNTGGNNLMGFPQQAQAAAAMLQYAHHQQPVNGMVNPYLGQIPSSFDFSIIPGAASHYNNGSFHNNNSSFRPNSMPALQSQAPQPPATSLPADALSRAAETMKSQVAAETTKKGVSKSATSQTPATPQEANPAQPAKRKRNYAPRKPKADGTTDPTAPKEPPKKRQRTQKKKTETTAPVAPEAIAPVAPMAAMSTPTSTPTFTPALLSTTNHYGASPANPSMLSASGTATPNPSIGHTTDTPTPAVQQALKAMKTFQPTQSFVQTTGSATLPPSAPHKQVAQLSSQAPIFNMAPPSPIQVPSEFAAAAYSAPIPNLSSAPPTHVVKQTPAKGIEKQAPAVPNKVSPVPVPNIPTVAKVASVFPRQAPGVAQSSTAAPASTQAFAPGPARAPALGPTPAPTPTPTPARVSPQHPSQPPKQDPVGPSAQRAPNAAFTPSPSPAPARHPPQSSTQEQTQPPAQLPVQPSTHVTAPPVGQEPAQQTVQQQAQQAVQKPAQHIVQQPAQRAIQYAAQRQAQAPVQHQAQAVAQQQAQATAQNRVSAQPAVQHSYQHAVQQPSQQQAHQQTQHTVQPPTQQQAQHAAQQLAQQKAQKQAQQKARKQAQQQQAQQQQAQQQQAQQQQAQQQQAQQQQTQQQQAQQQFLQQAQHAFQQQAQQRAQQQAQHAAQPQAQHAAQQQAQNAVQTPAQYAAQQKAQQQAQQQAQNGAQIPAQHTTQQPVQHAVQHQAQAAAQIPTTQHAMQASSTGPSLQPSTQPALPPQIPNVNTSNLSKPVTPTIISPQADTDFYCVFGIHTLHHFRVRRSTLKHLHHPTSLTTSPFPNIVYINFNEALTTPGSGTTPTELSNAPGETADSHMQAFGRLLRLLEDPATQGKTACDVETIWRLSNLQPALGLDKGYVVSWLRRCMGLFIGQVTTPVSVPTTVTSSTSGGSGNKENVNPHWMSTQVAEEDLFEERDMKGADLKKNKWEKALEACRKFMWIVEWRTLVARLAYVCCVDKDAQGRFVLRKPGGGVGGGGVLNRGLVGEETIDAIVNTRTKACDYLINVAETTCKNWHGRIKNGQRNGGCRSKLCMEKRMAGLTQVIRGLGLHIPKETTATTTTTPTAGASSNGPNGPNPETQAQAQAQAQAQTASIESTFHGQGTKMTNGLSIHSVFDIMKAIEHERRGRYRFADAMMQQFAGKCYDCMKGSAFGPGELNPTNTLFPIIDLLYEMLWELRVKFLEWTEYPWAERIVLTGIQADGASASAVAERLQAVVGGGAVGIIGTDGRTVGSN